MRLSIEAIVQDVLLLWKQERDLLLRIAGVFFFLPLLGFGLLLVDLPMKPDMTVVERQVWLQLWFETNWPWVLGLVLVENFGTMVLFLLFLAPGQLTVGEAISRTVRIYPGLLVTMLLYGLAVAAGASLFLIPGLYIWGRLLLCPVAFAAAPEQGPLAALRKSIRLTEGLGWWLFGLLAIILLCGLFCDGIVNVLIGQEGSPALLDMAWRIVTATVDTTTTVLGLALLPIVLYRRLAEQRG